MPRQHEANPCCRAQKHDAGDKGKGAAARPVSPTTRQTCLQGPSVRQPREWPSRRAQGGGGVQGAGGRAGAGAGRGGGGGGRGSAQRH